MHFRSSGALLEIWNGWRICLWAVAVAVLGCPCFVRGQEAVPQDAPPTCAIIDTAQLSITPLLEARMLERTDITWVERTEIERVLREQELQSAFGAADGAQRAALGQLLKADVLVLLRADKNPDPKGPALIQCVVCETRHGLRLRTATVPDDKDVDAALTALVQTIDKGLQKRRRKIEAIVAVPPFLSDDLDFLNNHLQAAYARLVEQVLLERPGVVVVELGEAQAIARELTLDRQGKGLEKRELPLYVMGRYRHDAVDGGKRLRMSLRLVRGEEQLTLKGVRDLPPPDAGEWILSKTTELADQLAQIPSATSLSPDSEARQLAARARDFQRVGNWEEAYALYEASLLLHDDPETRRQAVMVAGRYALSVWTRDGSFDKAKHAMVLYERGLEHLERFLRTAGDLTPYQQKDKGDFSMEFEMFLYMQIAHPQNKPEIKEYAQELRRRRTDAYLRIARFRADAKFRDRTDNYAWDARAVWLAPQEEQLATILRIAKEWRDLPDIRERMLRMAHRGYAAPENTSALQKFLVDLAGISTDGEAVANTLRQRIAAHEQLVKEEAARRPAKPLTKDPSIREIELTPAPQAAQMWASRQTKSISGMLALDNGDDLIWTGSRYFLLEKGSDRLRHAFDADHLVVAHAFDGKYLWLAQFENRRSAALLAIDLTTGQKTRFNVDDGLPFVDVEPNSNHFDRLQLAGVGPGHVCLAGYIGRTWLANVKLSTAGKKQVNVFHEARDAENPSDRSQDKSTTVAFQPSFFFALRGESANACRLILGRKSSQTAVRNSPLVIDPLGETVAVADYVLPGDVEKSLLAANRDAIFVLRANYPRGPQVMRVAYPGTRMERWLVDAPDGKLAATTKSLEFIGKKWWTCDLSGSTIREQTAGVPWHHGHMFFVAGVDNSADRAFVMGRDGHPLTGAVWTNHFGAVAIMNVHGEAKWYWRDKTVVESK